MGDVWHDQLLITTPSSFGDFPDADLRNSENVPRSFVKAFGLLTPPSSIEKPRRLGLTVGTNIKAEKGQDAVKLRASSACARKPLQSLTKALDSLHVSSTVKTPECCSVTEHLLGNLDGEAAEQKARDLLEVQTTPVSSPKKLKGIDSYLNRRLRPAQRPTSHAKHTITPTQSPDRFNRPRRLGNASREMLMVGKPVAALKYREKVRRRRSSHSDPFGYPERENQISDPVRLIRPRRVMQPTPLRPGVLVPRVEVFLNSPRQVSAGAIWNVGGRVAASNPTQDTSSHRTNLNIPSNRTRVHTSRFLEGATTTDDLEIHERRIALALGIDRTKRVLASSMNTIDDPRQTVISPSGSFCCRTSSEPSTQQRHCKTVWTSNGWLREPVPASSRHSAVTKPVPTVAFRYVFPQWGQYAITSLMSCTVLEAPGLRDDFYCSVLAFSRTANLLAVGLADKIYLWNETDPVWSAPQELGGSSARSGYITSLAFSSEQGRRGILAISHGDGQIVLWSPVDREQRVLRLRLTGAAVHVSYRPIPVRRPSQRVLSIMTEQEMLLVGDDSGAISVYFVEWPRDIERNLFGWHGGIVLHSRLAMHRQQICGIAWSPDGEYLATGGNDNRCYLIETQKILSSRNLRSVDGNENLSNAVLGEDIAKHQWRISAAVKAIAFCPWQRGLVAIGGGSNDRCIHFYHTISGTCLATIDCAAQVTSLIWSTTRREIAATFGFAQPEHPFRVAVYSWPSCQQTVAIPWHEELRALYAVPYPGGPDTGISKRTRGAWPRRHGQDGCIIVAGSDGSVKFHEVWCESRRATGSRQGLLGGSDILESLHGIDKDGVDTIR